MVRLGFCWCFDCVLWCFLCFVLRLVAAPAGAMHTFLLFINKGFHHAIIAQIDVLDRISDPCVVCWGLVWCLAGGWLGFCCWCFVLVLLWFCCLFGGGLVWGWLGFCLGFCWGLPGGWLGVCRVFDWLCVWLAGVWLGGCLGFVGGWCGFG